MFTLGPVKFFEFVLLFIALKDLSLWLVSFDVFFQYFGISLCTLTPCPVSLPCLLLCFLVCEILSVYSSYVPSNFTSMMTYFSSTFSPSLSDV